MVGLPRRKHREARAAEHEREEQQKAAQSGKDREKTADEVYKHPPEPGVLGWGHRGESPP
ncbi:hypothetical protein [Streptomyces cinnamoneus]|uniref:Uncharacterized protein n=1 Tax=Streptomyces cinnamoneus TaxID=53446 RepID=A0A918TKA5_STRCJ|nr:hypothetical protein [Streptomyces cinnamoneus]GHC45748.1 hypothetical protein GCM10010507_21390 [Streptomyces cinnamoneus]